MSSLGLLNSPQQQAATHGGGPLLILAGAGSGKTRVITHRIAHLVANGVPPRAIAALTFTNKAAGEMRDRVATLLGNRKRAQELTVGTFHSLGLQVLKSERSSFGFPRGFVIYDSADQLGIVREILRRVDVEGRKWDIKAILARISLAKNAFISPEEFSAGECDQYDEITAELYPKYQEALRGFAAVDFDDLIVEPVRLFDRDASVRDRWQSKFAYVMVDEYQDTNRAQLLMVKHLVARHGNICVVGDDDQSIYSWRGAEPQNILQFTTLFPGANIVRLEQNYRSTPMILRAANAVIQNNSDRHGKTLWTENADTVPLVHAVAPESTGEARFVATEIAQLVGEGYQYKDFAVLYRSNMQAQDIEEQLREYSIPYAMYGGQQFYERKEVKDVLAYLRIALNARDEIALRRVINYPARGIGASTLSRLAMWSKANRKPLWNALTSSEILSDIRSGIRTSISRFVDLVNKLGAALQGPRTAAAAVEQLVENVDLISDIRAGSASVKAAQRRIENVMSLVSSLQRYQEKSPGADALVEYLRLLSLNTSEEEKDHGNKVTLTTLHGSKGLEFPVVFLVGLEEGLLPHARTLMPRATDVIDPDHAADISEERRLAYVGITRAMKRLYLTRSVMRVRSGKPRPRTPSRFLLEIPEELVDSRDISEEARAPVEEQEVRAFFQNFAFDEV